VKERNHNINLFLGKQSHTTGLSTIGIMYLIGGTKVGQIGTGIKIPPKAWDTGRKHLKVSWLERVPESDRIDEIYIKMRKYRSKLSKGEMSWETAKYEILDKKQLDTGSVIEYTRTIKPTNKRKQGTIDKYIEYIEALNKRKYKGIDDIQFNHLNDPIFCEKLEEYILGLDCKSTSKRQYLQNLQLVWKIKNGIPTGKRKKNVVTPAIFYNIPPEKSNPRAKTPVKSRDFTLALNDVRTLQQFEAILMWLYSLSLLGLDGIDIINIDESDIVTEGYDDVDYYHPEIPRLNNKLHIDVIRHKLQYDEDNDYPVITRVVNLYPTLLIKKLLEHCIKHNHPQLAYKGKDKLKLFNFYTMDKKTREHTEGYYTWDKLSRYYRGILTKRLGASLQYTRSTSVKLGMDIGVDIKVLDANLGHSNEVSRSFKHYASSEQQKLDTYHIFSLQQFDIMKKLQNIYTIFKNKHQLINSKEIPFIPDELMPVDLGNVKTLDEVLGKQKKISTTQLNNNLLFQPLTRWTIDLENRYQKLMSEAKEGVEEFDPDYNKFVMKPLKPEEYSDELKELIKRKEEYNKGYVNDVAYQQFNANKSVRVVFNKDGYEISHN
jgi:hypothetical protein